MDDWRCGRCVSIPLSILARLSYHFVCQICLHTPGLPEDQDPDYECLMVPNGVSEGKLAEAGFMYNQEKGSWYHQGTEFGRRKAEPEDRSVEKMVNFLEVKLANHYCSFHDLLFLRSCAGEEGRLV